MSAPSGRSVRVYADGIFDLFHLGHCRMLEQAKHCLGSETEVYLLVGVCSDAVTGRMKGKTVLTERERYESVRHCRWVDEVVEDAPWVIDEEFIQKHQIDYVAHDEEPYPGRDGQEDVYAFVKSTNRFVATRRTEGISTTDIIGRVIRDYEVFVRRNLDRGVHRSELNVGFLTEKTIQGRRWVHWIAAEAEAVMQTVWWMLGQCKRIILREGQKAD